MEKAIKEDYEKYLLVSAKIYAICLDTWVTSRLVDLKTSEKMVLGLVKEIAKIIASCEKQLDFHK